MDKPVQGMTPPELRAELQQTRSVWDEERGVLDMDVFTETGVRAPLSVHALRHQAVEEELERRGADVPRVPAGPDESPVDPMEPANSA